MQILLPMPKPGETIAEALIVQWLKKEGENINEGQALFEMETEKAVFEYESPLTGKIKQVLVQGGKKVSVGTPIALLEVEDEQGKRYINMGIAMPATEQNQSAQISVSKIEKVEPVKITPPKVEPATASVEIPNDTFVFATPPPAKVEQAALANVTPLLVQNRSEAGHTFLSPYLKKIARETGLTQEDVQALKGTGTGGRITEEDIKNYQPIAKAVGQSSTSDRATIIRARIAENLTRSKREIPHAGAGVEIDVDSLYHDRKVLLVSLEQKYESKLTLFTPFAYAAVQVLKEDPYLNSVYEGEGKIKFLSDINLGISVSTERGLMVGVLKKAQELGFVDFWLKANDLVERVRDGKASPDDFTGGTFTVNNPGALGSDKILQIIPPGQVAILGFNRVTQKPAVVNGQVLARYMMNVDLQFDHRVADGKEGLRFLVALKKKIEEMQLKKLI